MFTCDKEMGADATDLFNYLTGYSSKKEYQKLIVAPINLRSRMEALIRREIEVHEKSGNGHLVFKVNSMVDKKMIQLLYKASQAGVKIDLFVRGICCLRPGIPEISENIQVTSIVGRFLEHSRIYYFRNDGNEEIYLGSADLMPRNIDRRVEVLFPVQDQQMIKHIYDNVLSYYYKDNTKARKMLPDGSYVRLKPQINDDPLNIQSWFISARR
jgi:polyphosphate kinase